MRKMIVLVSDDYSSIYISELTFFARRHCNDGVSDRDNARQYCSSEI